MDDVDINSIQQEVKKEENKSLVAIIFGVIIFFLIIIIVFFVYQNTKLQHATQTAPVSTSAAVLMDGWKTYSDSNYKFTFNYPISYSILSQPDLCSNRFDTSGLSNNKQVCLSLLFIKASSNDFGPIGSFSLIKGIGNVNISGQVSEIKYDLQLKEWIETAPDPSNPQTTLPIWAYTFNGLPIIKDGNGGSQGSSYFYIIPDYKNDVAAIFVIPQSYRLRCDNYQGDQQAACNNYYNDVIKKWNNGEDTVEWLPESYLKSLYQYSESMITSFRFGN